VDVYLCGHDHNLQHLRNVGGGGIDFIVCGAGGAWLYPYDPANQQTLMQVTRIYAYSFIHSFFTTPDGSTT